MKKINIILLVCFCLFLTVPLMAGEKNLKGSVAVGAFLQGDDDALDRAAEYFEDESSPTFRVNLDTYNDSSDLYVDGNYEGEYTNELKAKGNLLRHISVDFDYSRLFHRKDYDTLFIQYDKNNFSPAVATGKVAFDANPDGKVYGVNKFIADDLVTSPGGQWYGFEQDSTAVDKDYYIRRSELKTKVSFAIPSMETLKVNLSGRWENRDGYEHKTAMVGKCTVCHVRGMRKKIDETTRDLSAGVSFTGGPLYLSYSHMYRDFYVSNNAISTTFDTVEGLRGGKPDKYIIFAPRLNSETYGGTEEVSKTPESQKSMDTFKMRFDLPYYSTLAASYTSSNIKNNDSYGGDNIDLDQDALNLRFTTHLLDRKLSLTAKFRYLELDRDTVHAELEKSDAYYFQPNYSTPVTYNGTSYNYDMTKTYYYNDIGEPVIYDVEGESTYDREQYVFGIDAVYRMLKNKLKFRLGYEYENIDRDHYEVYEGDKRTERNTFKAGIDFKPLNNLSGRFKFEYSNIDDPFAKPKAGCIAVTSTGTGDLKYGGGGKAAYPLVYAQRTYTGSTSPSEIYNYSLNLSWIATNNLTLSFLGKYSDSENDEGNTDWDYDGLMLGFDGTLLLSEKLALSFGYNYEKASTDSKLTVGLYAG